MFPIRPSLSIVESVVKLLTNINNKLQGFNKGQLTKAESQSVVVASDQTSIPTTPNSFSKKIRDGFSSLNLDRWKIVSQGNRDLLQVDGNAGSASYLVFSKSPYDADTETVLESNLQGFQFPLELATGVHVSQRTLGQEFSLELISTEPPLFLIADISIASIQQTTTTLTVITAAAHNLSVGQRIGIKNITSDSRLNYVSLVVATTATPTTFTATSGPMGAIGSLTVGPYLNQGSVYYRPAMSYAKNGTSIKWEQPTATQASFYAKSEGSEAFPTGTLAGNHSITIGSTTGQVPINAMGNYSFRPTTEYKLSALVDKLQWSDVGVDSTGQPSNRLNLTQVVPDPDLNYKVRFKFVNNASLPIINAKIVSVSKTGTTTATVVTGTPHGLTTGDYVNIYGVRDFTSFPNLTTATIVASIVDSTTFTIIWVGAFTATSFGGFVSKSNGQTNIQGVSTILGSSVSISNSILTLIGSSTWIGVSIGDYVELVGCTNNVDGASLGLDGTYRVRDLQTTSLFLEPIGSTVIPVTLASVNCGGAIVRRTDFRVSYFRLLEYERLRVEALPRPAGDSSAALPVAIQTIPAVSLATGSATIGNVGINSGAATVIGQVILAPTAVTIDVASAAITTSATVAAITPTGGTEYQVNIPISAATGTNRTLDIVIQESDDSGTNWYDVYHFPRITGTGFWRSPKLLMRGNRLRYVQTVGGTTPSFTRTINRLQGNSSVPAYRQFYDRTIVLTTLASSTPVFEVGDCRNLSLSINIGTATTPPALILQGTNDQGATWTDIGTALTAVASSTVVATINNVNFDRVRATVSSAGNTVVAGYVLIKGF